MPLCILLESWHWISLCPFLSIRLCFAYHRVYDVFQFALDIRRLDHGQPKTV